MPDSLSGHRQMCLLSNWTWNFKWSKLTQFVGVFFFLKYLVSFFFLFRCSFHSYADSTYAKHLESGGGTQSIYGTLGGPTPIPSVTPTPGGTGGGGAMAEATMTMRAETPREYQQSVIEVSEDSINSIEKVEEWKVLANGNRMPNGASPRENGKRIKKCLSTGC